MTPWWRLVTQPDQVKPAPDHQPDPELEARMQRATTLRERAEQILAVLAEQKPTRPA
jgi:hypothetical protein